MLRKFKIVFFIIPYHHIGGAERVHLNIIKVLPYKPFVFFDCTNSEAISKEFRDNAYCFLVTNAKRKKYAFKFIKLLSFIFPVIVFGCNSSLFYSFISSLKNKIKAIDLTHAFSFPDYGIELGALPYVQLLDKRIVINNKTYEDYRQLYSEKGISADLLERFVIIANGIPIREFESNIIDSRFSNFTIGFVGRNSAEKRPELFFELVNKLNIESKVIGDNFDSYKNNFSKVNYFENSNDSESIRAQFSDISVLIVSSSREGFPLVIMEAMELGIPVIATNVGSIEEHLIDNLNGFLGPVEEDDFLSFAVRKINNLRIDKELYVRISFQARKYAEENFGIDKFNKKYRELFYG